MSSLPTYVLITPARNEAKFIGQTIESVVAQTIRPIRWIIVSDGSTDGTDDIVNTYVAKYPWIELLRMPERSERHFAGKVHAFNAGYARTKDLTFEAVGNVDADISFPPDYFCYLLSKLAEDHEFGVVGTPFKEKSNFTYDYRFVSLEHVSGACQLFRRKCFEEIGGYVPVVAGSIDHIAVVTARMKGWKTRTFTDFACIHHRELGTAQASAIAARFKYGMKDYALGNHPLWEVSRTIYQISKRPYAIGGAALLSGYLWAFVRRRQRPVSHELVAFVRKEQMRRLRDFLGLKKVRNQSLPSSPECCRPESATRPS